MNIAGVKAALIFQPHRDRTKPLFLKYKRHVNIQLANSAVVFRKYQKKNHTNAIAVVKFTPSNVRKKINLNST